MGFFSFTSAISGKDIMNVHTNEHEGIVIVLPDDKIVQGSYDGYGVINTEYGVSINIHAVYGEYLEGGDLDSYLQIEDADRIEELRDIGIGEYFKRDENNKYIMENVKAILPSELPNGSNDGLFYDDLGWSKDADGQGYWISSNYPFEEGDDYWTIEDGEVVYSCWDEVSEEIHDENPDIQYYLSELHAKNNLNKF